MGAPATDVELVAGRPAKWGACARFGRLVAPDAIYLAAFAAMTAESVAAGEADQLVAAARVRRRPSHFLRRLQAAQLSGTFWYWLVSDDDVLATGTLRSEGTRWFGHLGFFVRPSRRNQGIGRAVMADLVAMAHRSGLAAPRAMVDPGNVASRRAIEMAGGTLVDIISDFGSSRCVYEFAPDAQSGSLRQFQQEKAPAFAGRDGYVPQLLSSTFLISCGVTESIRGSLQKGGGDFDVVLALPGHG